MPAGGHSGDHQRLRHEEMSAREMALAALIKIDTHTEECNRRDEVFQRQYSTDVQDIKNALADVHRRVSGHADKVAGNAARLTGIVMAVGGTLILGLIGLVSYLLKYGPPWPLDPS